VQHSLPDPRCHRQLERLGGHRSQPALRATRKPAKPTERKNLKLKWAFAFPATTRVRAQPLVTPTVTFIGSQDGTVYALDSNSGCIHWTFAATSEVRGALRLHRDAQGKHTLLFGDTQAFAYAVNASTGELQWKTTVHSHPMAGITGSVTADQHKVYVPVSSLNRVAPLRNRTTADEIVDIDNVHMKGGWFKMNETSKTLEF